ncbi:MAG TPA: hypothetical protein DCO77_05665 [Nitrospiraceae bacterium]|nr:hypothetical protein [Nitrospiraceae bacterium]
MKKRLGTIGLSVVLSLFVAACVSPGAKAPKTASGKGISMYVLINRGITRSMTNNQVKNRNQVGKWMERDLPALLKKAGYKPRLITRRSQYKSSGNAYLLVVKITSYNPGAKAARMFVGYGAGATSMKTHYELYGKGRRRILADDLGVGSGRDWRNVIRKIDTLTVRAVSQKLNQRTR